MAAVPFSIGTGELMMVHKRECHDKAEKKIGNYHWKEMYNFLDLLIEVMAPGTEIKWPWRED